MILSLNDLRKYDFQLSKINIFYQKPRYRTLNSTNRPTNGFLLILRGNCTYFYRGGSFTLEPGSLVYLPYGSAHHLEINSQEIEFYRIDFHLTVENEVVLFSNVPLKMCHTAPDACAAAVQKLMDHCQFVSNSIRKTELMCSIFQTLSQGPVNTRRERLAPAIRYLRKNLTEKIDCSGLAGACNLGSAQFYNLFHEEYGMSPLEYRDSLLVDRAVVLLQDGAFSVSEIAEVLGFESVSYFSRFFKKHRGVPPSKLTKKAPLERN